MSDKISKFDQFTQCRRDFSNPGQRNISESCCQNSANGYIDSARTLKISICYDNDMPQVRIHRQDEFGNSICWHFITEKVSS
jgi:hypothetical protein